MYCKDCKFKSIHSNYYYSKYFCTREMKQDVWISPIYGEINRSISDSYNECYDERYDESRCGIEGKWFKPKFTIINFIRNKFTFL